MPRRRLPDNVVPFPSAAPADGLTVRARAQLDLLELLRDLDAESQRVLVAQLADSQRRMRRHGPVGALVRGERGPVAWKAGSGRRWLVAPAFRRLFRPHASA